MCMKKDFMGLVAVILLGLGSCKKNGQMENESGDYLPKEKKWVVRTIAGEGSASFINGPVLSATFHFPEDVAIAPDGGIYVTDVLNFCVRKIAAGQVSTFAGSGFGFANGNGSSAQFKNPFSIALDSRGNVYATDENDPRVRKITPAGVVSTYAGSETEGFADGNADAARFFPGNSIITDQNDNLYVADARNNRIRKIDVSGQVTTIAGGAGPGFSDGNAAAAKFSSPGGIAIDKQGNLYVIDRGNFRIRKITASGNVSTIAGTGIQGNQDGNAGEAQFSFDMHDIVVDNTGNLYVEDGNRIRKISSQGVVSTIAGSTPGFEDGDGTMAKFNFLSGMGIDATGDIYVTDLINNRVRKISFE
jgi:sugar lactone lactonase YvrE